MSKLLLGISYMEIALFYPSLITFTFGTQLHFDRKLQFVFPVSVICLRSHSGRSRSTLARVLAVKEVNLCTH